MFVANTHFYNYSWKSKTEFTYIKVIEILNFDLAEKSLTVGD